MEFDLNAMMGDMGVGAVVGFVTGYAVKKMMKLALALIGAYVASLLWLEQKGVLIIDKDRLFNLVGDWTHEIMTAGQKFMALLPGTAAFVGGFALGFHKG
ncbi:protein, conserved, FUN14 family [Thermococcus sp. 4557]|uniref:FUN14 domain-containing protein n=1 Tax=Thermococcus sp. (strain CGMCC 1.5172 / 4557) TaxID=1042877 RepID=UPI000219EBE4|nr:FUN14 domain-containing protein [Thermococcus sp. 4557]AEK72832.1 protein, conserved, FUN14 family [Thermococcus sp. 4557]